MRPKMFRCNSCGEDWLLVPFYPARMSHGPDGKCSAALGWTILPEHEQPEKYRATSDPLR